MSAFDDALAFVLEAEGGYSNRPEDRGGKTMKGITQVTYNVYRASKGLALADVREISDAEVRNLYLTRYWNATSCDAYPGRLGLCVFDFAVNSGPINSVRYLQRALWITPEDGIAGPETITVAQTRPWREVAWAHLSMRRAFLRSLPDASVNAGWFNRINRLRDVVFAAEEVAA